MRPMERIQLIERIGRELQSRWTHSGISSYLRQWTVDLDRPTSDNGMSKYVYVRDLLQEESDEKIIDIADDLEIQHDVVRNRADDLPESNAWRPNHFRVFLSHLASFKATTAKLQMALRPYGISAFVAHEDIEPTAEWQTEILKALFSMDAMVAILTPGFKESNWTDQEVGVALGRDVLIVPIRRELDPYGFISKYQALQGIGATVPDVADAVFKVLAKHNKSKRKLLKAMVDLLLVASSRDDVAHWLDLISRCEEPVRSELERLKLGAQEHSIVIGSAELTDRLNAILRSHGIEELLPQVVEAVGDDDAPF